MFNLQLDWDRPNQLSSQSANHILRIRINPTNASSRTLPLHLAIALDTSQSMKGEKLTSAKQACQEIFKHLRDRDKLSLASYSHRVNALLNQVQGNDQQAQTTINQLQAEGVTRTDLALNWLKKALPKEAGMIRVGILVTDGHATNSGGILLEDLNPLLTQTTELTDAGIILCTVGLGNAANFNTEFLVNLSDRGRGAFIYADRPEDLSQQLQERLTACQSIATDELKLQLQPLNGSTLQGFCQFRPEYLPLEETAPHQLTLSGIRANQPTDILVNLHGPTQGFGEAPTRKPFLNIELTVPNLAPIPAQTSLQYTNSYREAQQFNTEVNSDRLGWIMNQCSTDLTRTSDPHRTGEFLVDLQVAATKSGQTAIAQQAAQQLTDLQKSGKLDAHQLTNLLQETRKQGSHL
jgi:Ca-activated chloride channel family protein